MDLITIWMGISTVGMIAFAYVGYRQREIIELAIELIEAYSDKEISEYEYGKIVDKLKAVIYKK